MQHTRPMRSCQAAAILIIILLSGCIKQGSPALHPGAANAFDSQSYDTIITLRAAVQQASMEVTQFPQYKEQVNQAVTAFNTLQDAYKTYHTAALAGNSTTQQQQALTNGITSLVAQLAKLQAAFGVKIQ